MEVRVPGLSPRCRRAATGPRAKVREVEGAGRDRAEGGRGRYQLSWLFSSFSAPLFPSAVAPSSTPSPVPAGHSSPAPLSPREQPEGTRPMPRAGRDAVPEEGRCEGTRCLGRPAARAQPLALGGHTLCHRGSFDRCAASARLGGTNRPRPLAAPVTCSIPAGDRRSRLIVAR